ncbi:MAG: PEP-CTERM sorting domain-containing protein [Verrucomicrobium sp.]
MFLQLPQSLPTRFFQFIHRVPAFVVACGFAGAVHGSTLIGPGPLLGAAGSEGGDRMNISDSPLTGQALGPGNYQVSDFTFAGRDANGTVTPFLVMVQDGYTLADNRYQVIWTGSAVTSSNGTVTSNPLGGFSLSTTATVYAGFYSRAAVTGSWVTVAYTNNGSTDHQGGAFTNPNVKGSTGAITAFGNANLVRSYSFGIGVDVDLATTLGPRLISSINADGAGTRLNVDLSNTIAFSAGTYSVTNFSFNGMSATGTVTPFLATKVGSNYQILWQGNAVNSALGGVGTDYADGTFTLASDQTVYGGFFTDANGRVAYLQDVGGLTDHDSSFTPPAGAGQTFGGISNPSLSRTYAFQFSIVPEPSRAVLLVIAAGSMLLRRSRRTPVQG